MERLKLIRRAMYLTQSEMAEMLGCSRETVGHMESARRSGSKLRSQLYNYLEIYLSRWLTALTTGTFVSADAHQKWLGAEKLREQEELMRRFESDRALWVKAINELEQMKSVYNEAHDGVEFSSFLYEGRDPFNQLLSSWASISRQRALEAMQKNGPWAQNLQILKIEGLETNLKTMAEWLGRDTTELDYMRATYKRLVVQGVNAGIMYDLSPRKRD